MKQENRRDRKTQLIASIGVGVAVVLHYIVEWITDYQEHVSFGIALALACAFGLIAGLAIRYMSKAIVRTHKDPESSR